jgi:hypothetical protein
MNVSYLSKNISPLVLAVSVALGAELVAGATAAEEPKYRESLVFPLHPQHNHAPGIGRAIG